EEQYLPDRPGYDLLTYVNEGGAVKYKNVARLSWERGPLTLGWAARYFSSYKQYGAAVGPLTMRQSNGGVFSSTYINAMGGDTVPSQIYHDFTLGYDFRQHASGRASPMAGWVDGLSMRLAVRNVFDTVAPLDPYHSGNYYMSPFGD